MLQTTSGSAGMRRLGVGIILCVLLAVVAWQGYAEHLRVQAEEARVAAEKKIQAETEDRARQALRRATTKADSLFNSAKEGTSAASFEEAARISIADLSEIRSSFAATGIPGNAPFSNAASDYLAKLEEAARMFTLAILAEVDFNDGGAPSRKDANEALALEALWPQLGMAAAAVARERGATSAKARYIAALRGCADAFLQLGNAAEQVVPFAGGEGILVAAKVREMAAALNDQHASLSK